MNDSRTTSGSPATAGIAAHVIPLARPAHSHERTTASPRMVSPLVAPIVSTQWLCDHIGSDSVVVLDASVLRVTGFDSHPTWLSGLDQYLVGGHIPGAIFADLIDEFSNPTGAFGFERPSIAQFEAAAAAVGVTNDSTVIVYDTAAGQWAARLWWLFRANGYDRVAVLDGGLTKWNHEDRPIDTGSVEPARGAFTSTERPQLWADKTFVASVVSGEAAATLVCAVPASEFAAESGERARRGHIPGSVSVPSGRLVDAETNAFLRPDALRALFAPTLDLTARSAVAGTPTLIVAYCDGAIAAAADALALALIGVTDVAIYDGSLTEWSVDDALPLVGAAIY
ncbi:sulfurtransferase [Subtercola sp. RTI3]|uniref:sulfurtransferase n=1 Tax=Subtercola sp. RTI3 TaxID=3048639 RepID=UPI002B227529|nr:rhodanese-like domain-containing protein [Subtercola sp. RTI3]MEA9985582.1 rhodanese-like domain-containing protein [Subtercola sp. RTI3]